MLEQFRDQVTKQGLNTSVFDDAYLLRFLRARKFNLEKTTKMWNDFIEWRVRNNVDNIYVHHSATQVVKLPEIPTVRKCYPHGYHKTDKFVPIVC